MSYREVLITETFAEWPEGHSRNKIGNTTLRAKEQFIDTPKWLRSFMLCGVEANKVSCTYNVGLESIIYLLSRLRNPAHLEPAEPDGKLICMWMDEPGYAFLSIDTETVNVRDMELDALVFWIEEQLDKLEDV
jgi:hypothetical protein